jgi:tryptophanyl-tRNA synthetase
MSATQTSSHAATAARAAGCRGAEFEAAIARDASRFRVLTGDRPTGPLHDHGVHRIPPLGATTSG